MNEIQTVPRPRTQSPFLNPGFSNGCATDLGAESESDAFCIAHAGEVIGGPCVIPSAMTVAFSRNLVPDFRPEVGQLILIFSSRGTLHWSQVALSTSVDIQTIAGLRERA